MIFYFQTPAARQFNYQCIFKGDEMTTINFQKHKFRQTEASVFDDHLMPYLRKYLPKTVIDYAADCLLTSDKTGQLIIPKLFWDYFFPTFFLMQWSTEKKFEQTQMSFSLPIAQQYANQHKSELLCKQLDFIDVGCSAHYSFYKIIEVLPGTACVVQDILLGNVYHVFEEKGSCFFKPDEIIFSLLFPLGQQAVLVGPAPFQMPARYYSRCLYIRDILRQEGQITQLTQELLWSDYSPFIVNNFIQLMLELYNTSLNKNKDGDPYQTCQLHYQSNLKPNEILTQLLPLTIIDEVDVILSDPRLDFPCVEYDETTGECVGVIGYIKLRESGFSVTTDTKMNAEKIKTFIDNFCTSNICLTNAATEPAPSHLIDPNEPIELDAYLPKACILENLLIP